MKQSQAVSIDQRRLCQIPLSLREPVFPATLLEQPSPIPWCERPERRTTVWLYGFSKFLSE